MQQQVYAWFRSENLVNKEYIMKNKAIRSLLVLALATSAFSANSATYNVGTFYTTPDNPEGDYTIDTSGLFYDEFDFRTQAQGSWRNRSSMTFSGSHSGMFDNELLLINLNSREVYNLEETFSVTVDNLRSWENYRFAITGAGLNSADPTVISSYSLSMDAALDPYQPGSPNPVPVPAAAWLFGSGLMGFMTYRRKQRGSTA
jgi:hypothetical protein